MDSPLLRHRVLPHIEPCALHAVNLVKCRATGGKALFTAMASLGCLMRQWRFSNGLRDQIHHHVSRRLRVVRAPRPDGCSARAENLARTLFAEDSDDWLYKKGSSGERTKSQLLEDIEAMVAAVDFGSAASEDIIHYCYAQEGDASHGEGASPGAPCCRDREESVAKVSQPLIHWFCQRSWEQSAESRWTKSVNLMRKVLTGCLVQRIFARVFAWHADELGVCTKASLLP